MRHAGVAYIREMELLVATKFNGKLQFNADPATVYAMVTDQKYVVEKNERTGGQNVSAKVEKDGDDITIVANRELPAEIPGYAKKFVGEKISTEQTDRWTGPNDDGSYNGTMDVTFGKAPLVVKGTFRIEAAGDGSTLDVNAEAKASVPFVSGKLEGVVAEQFQRAVRKEEEVGNDWLSR